ncbi:aminoacyl-tRNA hydrolase [Candidatus Azambacteria bacterium]|nr:aminoacyl-tRNA hydrolase [Candidatus Azambacteria bacterium]
MTYLILGLGNPGEEYENTRHNIGRDATAYLAALLGFQYFKLKPENIFVIYDDIDLPFGTIKISFNKSSGGHKGIESVIKKLKTKEFWRIRVGINPTKKKKDAMDLVLKKFASKDEQEIKKLKKEINEALICAITESPEKAMTLFNQ